MKTNFGKGKRLVTFTMLASASFLLLGADKVSKLVKQTNPESMEKRKIRTMANELASQTPENMRGQWREMARKSPRKFLQITCGELGPVK